MKTNISGYPTMHDPDTESQCLTALWNLAEADGLVTPEERTLFETFRRFIGGKTAKSLDLAALAKEVPSQAERVELIRLLLMLAIADGKTSGLEMAFVQNIALELRVNQEQIDDMRHQAYLSADL